MFNNLKSCLRNYYLKKRFTSFVYSGKENPRILATLLYPNGKWVKKQDDNIYSMYEETRDFSYERTATIYNATAMNPSEIYATADILVCDYSRYVNRTTKFNIVEVYNMETPKEQIINDMAFKKFVFELNDFEIKKCIVLYPQRPKIGQKVRITDFFIQEDITKQVLSVWKIFKEIPYQDLNPLLQTEKTTVVEDDVVFIDYSNLETVKYENEENYDYRSRPSQWRCRAKIGNENRIIYCPHKNNIAPVQVDFLIDVTCDYGRVYMRNSEFEKSHHREMAKMFPSKSSKLYELNEKVTEWKIIFLYNIFLNINRCWISLCLNKFMTFIGVWTMRAFSTVRFKGLFTAETADKALFFYSIVLASFSFQDEKPP